MKKLNINIVIAGRTYPVSISSPSEEEGMRKAAKTIESLIFKFEHDYAVEDKQDVLAMCALQFASTIEINSLINDEKERKALNKIRELTNLINSHLE